MLKKEELTATNEKQTLVLTEAFWLDSTSKVRRHTLLGENPASTRSQNKEEAENHHSYDTGVSPSKPSA